MFERLGFFADSLEKKIPDTVKMCTGTEKDSHEQLSPDISLFKSTYTLSYTIFLSSHGVGGIWVFIRKINNNPLFYINCF